MKININKLAKYIFMIAFVINLGFSFAPVFAQPDGTVKKTGDATVVDPNTKTGLQITLTNPLKAESLEDFVQIVLGVILKFLIPILAILFIWTGFQLVLAGGDKAARKTAKDHFFNIVIAAVLILGAWTFGNVIFNTLKEVGILN